MFIRVQFPLELLNRGTYNVIMLNCTDWLFPECAPGRGAELWEAKLCSTLVQTASEEKPVVNKPLHLLLGFTKRCGSQVSPNNFRTLP